MASAEFGRLLQSLVDAALVTDEHGVIRQVNAAAGILFGCAHEALIDTALDVLLPREQDQDHETVFLDGAPDAASQLVPGIRHPVSASHCGGSAFDVRVATSEVDDGVFVVVISPLAIATGSNADYLDILRQLIDSAVDGTIIIDSAGTVHGYNPAAELTFGYPPDEVIGENVSMLMADEFAKQHDSYLQRYQQEALDDDQRVVGMRRPVVARTSSGVMVPIRIAVNEVNLPGADFFVGSATKLHGDDGDSTASMVNELIERRTRTLRDQRDEFERLSSIDSLTQLANRREFDRSLERELRRGRRANAATALVMLDLDHFKLYNDHYGHQAGDECLQQMARVLESSFRRGTDLAARYGGEEFAVVMGTTNYPTAMMLAERLVAAVERAAIPHEKSPTAPHVTVSVGVTAVSSAEDTSSEQLIEWADNALYEAKHSGRNRVCGTDHGGDTSLLGISR